MVKAGTRRKAYYVATIAAMVALTAGFALATFGLGGTNTVFQGSQTTTVSSVAGLTWSDTKIVELGSAIASSACTTQGSPCSLTTSGATECAGGAGACAANDFVEQVTISTVVGTAIAANPLSLTMYIVIGGATSTGTTYYYSQTSTSNTLETVIIDYDIGTQASGPGVVTSVSVIASS